MRSRLVLNKSYEFPNIKHSVKHTKAHRHTLNNSLVFTQLPTISQTDIESMEMRVKWSEYSKSYNKGNKEVDLKKYPTAKDINNKYKALNILIQQALSVTKNTITLEERKKHKIIIFEGHIQYCKIQLEGKKAPLTVFIKKLKGNCQIIGTSKTPEPKKRGSLRPNKEATEYTYDSVYKTFQKKTLYLGIHALTYTVLILNTEFGILREKREMESKKSRARLADDLIAKLNEQIKVYSTSDYLVKKLNDEASIFS